MSRDVTIVVSHLGVHSRPVMSQFAYLIVKSKNLNSSKRVSKHRQVVNKIRFWILNGSLVTSKVFPKIGLYQISFAFFQTIKIMKKIVLLNSVTGRTKHTCNEPCMAYIAFKQFPHVKADI